MQQEEVGEQRFFLIPVARFSLLKVREKNAWAGQFPLKHCQPTVRWNVRGKLHFQGIKVHRSIVDGWSFSLAPALRALERWAASKRLLLGAQNLSPRAGRSSVFRFFSGMFCRPRSMAEAEKTHEAVLWWRNWKFIYFVLTSARRNEKQHSQKKKRKKGIRFGIKARNWLSSIQRELDGGGGRAQKWQIEWIKGSESGFCCDEKARL